MSDTLLSTTVHRAAALIGDRLPAAYAMTPGELLLDGDPSVHVMPEQAVAVRWPLGAEEGALVIAVPAESAAMLQAGPPERSLAEALTVRLAPALAALAPLFDGTTPELGDAVEVGVEEALAGGPGDAVSVQLDDAGVHRGTIAIRLVVTDEMLQPAPADDAPADGPAGAADAVAGAGNPVVAGPTGGNAVAGIPVQAPGAGPAGAPIPVTADGGPQIMGQARGQAGRQPYRDPIGPPQGDAHPADFASFDQLSSLPGQSHPLTMLGDVEMGVTAELGRTRLSVREVLGLNQGSIIELDRAAGSPVDVVVNGTLIARGEVVVIDEEFGIRITEIVGMDADAAVSLPLAQ